jgi:predicted DsbA family dithiol-disulfide isomerase
MTGPAAAPPAVRPVRVSVWSDCVCPFCYLEFPVLDGLAAGLGDRVAVEWRAFEPRPAPEPTLDPDGAYLHRVWDASVHPMAARRGLAVRLPPVQPRSREALEAAAFARAAGRFEPLHRALFRAFFEEGADIGDAGVLAGIGEAAGLDPAALSAALGDGRHEAEVLADRARALALGVRAVPTMPVAIEGAGGGHLVPSGARPHEEVLAAV